MIITCDCLKCIYVGRKTHSKLATTIYIWILCNFKQSPAVELHRLSMDITGRLHDGVRLPVETETHDVSRLNYGVYYRARKQVALATDVWSQVFNVRIPTVPRGSLEHTAPDCMQLGLRYCRTARRIFMTAHRQHIKMTEQVRVELQHIMHVLLTDVHANGRRQNKRALIPFGGG